MLTHKTTRPHLMANVYWLIVRQGPKREAEWAETLKVDLYAREKALAVFSYKEEAQMFAGLMEDGVGWQVSEIKDEDLLELLHENNPSTDFIALDPFPERVAPETANLVSVKREYFSHYLLRQIQNNSVSSLKTRTESSASSA